MPGGGARGARSWRGLPLTPNLHPAPLPPLNYQLPPLLPLYTTFLIFLCPFPVRGDHHSAGPLPPLAAIDKPPPPRAAGLVAWATAPSPQWGLGRLVSMNLYGSVIPRGRKLATAVSLSQCQHRDNYQPELQHHIS